ncbi:helix-turn-helix transcriptional regulator [Microvirga lotononidis]|uniref:helix-turn-helix transcriptional regulator n=1 Tax=Microvirga lotononidis TaxID=864069 RepID=UPI000AAA7DC6|nr:DNA-binding protein [Microvirga lotononidis]WQO31390.1 DNA-binding protein [Microvirga lotononidis]
MFILDDEGANKLSSAKQYIVRRNLRARFGNISEMTLWRWERDKKLSFPRAIAINGRKYYDLAEIEEWERTRAAAGQIHLRE